MQNFSNPSLYEALKALKENQNNENLTRVSYALVNTKVLCPAKWDRDPQTDESGALHFDRDTKIQLMVVTNQQGEKLYPMFTDMKQVQALYNKEPINCLVLSINQYLPFLLKSDGDIGGIVVDPAGLNVVFPTKFLAGIVKADRQALNQTMIKRGEKLHLRNLSKEYQDLEAALISAGFHEKAIKNIYIKERMEDPSKPDQTHWFVLVDADIQDTGIFNRIGKACKDVLHNKNMEFMFVDQKLSRDIASTSKPIYTRV